MREAEFEEGVLKSRVERHSHEGWKWQQEGKFEKDKDGTEYLITGSYFGSSSFYSLIDIKVENRIGTG